VIALSQEKKRPPLANAYAERWIRSMRVECLDKLLIIAQAHLRRVMREYMVFFNWVRSHQGLAQLQYGLIGCY
jgi:hypothetical protein